MTTKTLKLYSIGHSFDRYGNHPNLNFETRELAQQYVLHELTPKNWPVNIELDNLTIIKKEKEWVNERYNVYYKTDPKRIKKVVEEKVKRDKYTETYNFEGYVNGINKWREKVNNYWQRDKVKGYYVFKVGDVSSEITKDSVVFRAPVFVQFVKAELLITPEVKVDGQPYQARKEEVKTEIMSDWLPVYVSGGSQFNPTKYLIDPNWTDGFWGAAREPYVAVTEYYVKENKIEIVTELQNKQ